MPSSGSGNGNGLGLVIPSSTAAGITKAAAAPDDVLAPLPPERRLTLVFERISAFVSVHTVPPSLSSRLASSLRRRRQAAKKAQRAAAAATADDVEAPPPTSTPTPNPSSSFLSPPPPPAEHRQILHAVSGAVLPGEVLVLMGPSGSGKTSLLSVVSGRAPRAVRTQGRVTVNGERFTKQAKRRVGFVLQDDMLFETLTVQETLAFAAELRLPRSTTAAQRAARVEGVIAALGLSKCRGTIIGGWERRGISGGERKRVSIGHELLIDPALLLLDEPTSGLDATTALHLARTLRRLARGGRAVCSTLHQPSSRIFQQLDRLMLLADGHVLYYGAASAAVPWFSALGFPCPFGVNVADFILDLAQGEVAWSSQAAAAARGKGSGGGKQRLVGSAETAVVIEEEEEEEEAAAKKTSNGNGHGLGRGSGGSSYGGGASTSNSASGGGDDDNEDDSGGDDLAVQPAFDAGDGKQQQAKQQQTRRSSDGALRGPAAVAALWRTYERQAAAATKAARAAAAAARAAAAAGGAAVVVGTDSAAAALSSPPRVTSSSFSSSSAAPPPVVYRGFGGERAVLDGLRLADGGPADDDGRAAGEAAAQAQAAEEAVAQAAEAAAASSREDADLLPALISDGGGKRGGGVTFASSAAAANGRAPLAPPAAAGPARSRSFLASMMQRYGSPAADDDENAPEFRREISRAFSRGPSQVFVGGGGGGKKGSGGGNGNGSLAAAAAAAAPFAASSDPNNKPSPIDRARLAMGLQDRGNATYLQQMRVLAARAARVRRFESLGTQRLVTIVGVALVTGLCWWQRGRSDLVSGAGDVLGLLFFIILFPSFSSLFAALFAFPAEYGMLCKERQSGMYRVSAYFFSRALVDLPLETVYPSLFVVACYWMGWLRAEAWAFFAHWAAMLLVVLVAQSTGLLLGAVFMDAKKAQTTATILMLCWMLCGGY
jgi:ABC-type multidrug transport system ATPase subunit